MFRQAETDLEGYSYLCFRHNAESSICSSLRAAEVSRWLQVYAGSVRVGFKVSKQARGCCRLRICSNYLSCGCYIIFELSAL